MTTATPQIPISSTSVEGVNEISWYQTWDRSDLAALCSSGVDHTSLRDLTTRFSDMEAYLSYWKSSTEEVRNVLPTPPDFKETTSSLLLEGEEGWPAALSTLPFPPRMLFYEGNTSLLNSKTLGLVTSRVSTPLGATVGQEASSFCQEEGLPLMLDGESDLTPKLVEQNPDQTCVLVLPVGLGNLPENLRALSDKVLENEGLLVSAHPPSVFEHTGNHFTPAPLAYRRAFRSKLSAALSTVLVLGEGELNDAPIQGAWWQIVSGRTLVSVLPRKGFRKVPQASAPVAFSTPQRWSQRELDKINCPPEMQEKLLKRLGLSKQPLSSAVALDRAELGMLLSVTTILST